MEIGYGIGVVSNSIGTYVRHASGYEAYECGFPERSLPDWKSAPIIPPYDSFQDYMRFNVGRCIVTAENFLGIKCKMNEEEVLHISPAILCEARKWKDESLAPKTIVREFWHHPSLTVAKCGDVIPDHVAFELKAKAHHKAVKVEQKAKNKKRISEILHMLEWNMYRFCRSPEEHEARRALINEYMSLTNGASFVLQPSCSASPSPPYSSSCSNSMTLTSAIYVIM